MNTKTNPDASCSLKKCVQIKKEWRIKKWNLKQT